MYPKTQIYNIKPNWPYQEPDEYNYSKYWENSNHDFEIYIHDADNRSGYEESSSGFISRRKYDERFHDKMVYYEDSDDNWQINRYDKDGNMIYYKDSHGIITHQAFYPNGQQRWYHSNQGHEYIYLENGSCIYEKIEGKLTICIGTREQRDS